MHCRRCQGWMVLEQLMDLQDDTGGRTTQGWRCVNCGAIVDDVILRHSAEPVSEPVKSARRWRRPAGIWENVG